MGINLSICDKDKTWSCGLTCFQSHEYSRNGCGCKYEHFITTLFTNLMLYDVIVFLVPSWIIKNQFQRKSRTITHNWQKKRIAARCEQSKFA